MRIANNHVVTMDYVLTLETGEQLDKSDDGSFSYLHGHGNIVPGLERQLEGLVEGDKRDIRVAPEEGYGIHEPENVQRIPKSRFDAEALKVGEMVYASDDEGNEVSGRIEKIDGGEVVVDFNHELAGKPLKFAITVRGVREATPEEIEIGSLAGDDCCGCGGGGCCGGDC